MSESLIIRRADHHSIAIAQAIHRAQMAAYLGSLLVGALALYRKNGFVGYKHWETGNPPLALVALRFDRGSHAAPPC